ncbi:uncharacterized protein LOC130702570 isoform X2 [Daphnia carinata]|uniref:uncharacterized protein LOC130702570 isoform X2 n=1 Tax=Daphnia carinata TaxID=120202 RepID=UPI00257A9EF7|nr:uncharacterized protein LOC130702570 isoform X2 [Daphnia carinata]
MTSNYFNVYVTHVVEVIDCQEKPNYCNLIFWGQKDRILATKMEEQIIACKFDSCPRPMMSDLKKEKVFCVPVNNGWLRATISDYAVDRNGELEVCCIDYGYTVMVPMACIKVVPASSTYIGSCHPLATKFLLADVVIQKGPRGKEPVLQYLKRNVENKNVKAVALGIHNDFEGVRVYLNDQLLAKLLVEKHLGTSATTYFDALKEPVPTQRYFSVASLSPPSMVKNGGVSSFGHATKPISNTLPTVSSQNKPNPVKFYTASYLEVNVAHSVMVTFVQNGPQKFVVQCNSPEAVRKLNDISRQLSSYVARNSKTLAKPERGDACIAISCRDKLFHRGVVTQVEDIKFAQVYFVDYGYTELVDLRSMYEIPSELVAINLLAFRVTLEESAALMTHDGISEAFTRLVLYRSFKCHVSGETIPQSVILVDEAGRSVKDLVLAALVESQKALNVSELLKTTSLSPILPGANIKIAAVEVQDEENLFVTYAGPPGQFFGQFERRPVSELEALKNELRSAYSSCGIPGQIAQVPLLYSDLKSHVGDYAVIRWATDKLLYRVKVINEYGNDVSVSFVDYGNSIKISRQEIWAPMKSLELFSIQPFGIYCCVSGIKVPENEWKLQVSDKSVRVKLGQPINGVYPATFDNPITNDINRPLSACSNQSPVTEKRGPSVDAVKPMTNRKLEFDAPQESGFVRNAIPNIAFDQAAILNDELDDSWAPPKADGKVPNRQKTQSISSMSSNASQSQVEQMDWESIESKQFPSQPISQPAELTKRVIPISLPTRLFYPPQKGLEGTTTTVEIVFVDNPNSFYCHLVETGPLLEDLMDKLARAYTDASKESIKSVSVGVACVAQYTDDGGWYRGQVLNVEGSEVEVLFVDYGNKQRTPTSLVKDIHEEFVKLPPQAYHCSLAGVQDSTRSWTSEDKARFEQVGMGKRVTATFSERCENDKYPVRLLLVMEALGQPGALPVVINDLFAPTRKILPVPDVANYPALPISFDSTEVNVAWFHNIGKFFLTPVNLAPYQKELDKLGEYYTALSSTELIEDSPCVGLPCVVRFKADDRFYRSQILAICGNFAQVLFVDYGNEQETPLKDLKRIHPRFLKCPQLTWQCRLKNVIMPDSEIHYSQDLKMHINTCFPHGQILRARFYPPTDGIYNVDLSVPEIGDVAQYLVKNKILCFHNICSGKEVKVPPQNLDFVPDKIISTGAFVSFAKTPMEFWIQLDPNSVDVLMEKSDTIVTQPEFLNDKTSFVPVPGVFCLAFFSDDRRWCRAIVETVEPNRVVVNYIDYGNSCAVALDHLRALPVSLADKPAMAFKCCLDGIESPVSTEVTASFLGQVLDFVATVKCIKIVNGVLHVRLSNTADKKDLTEKIGLLIKPVELEVYVAYSISPDNFWIQRKEDESKLAEIQDLMYRELEGANAGSYRMQGHPVPGPIYAVNHPIYHTWYRAQVEHVDGHSRMAEVQFIDYGDRHKVSLSDFRHLPNSLKDYPSMAIESCLNFQSRPKHWPEQALKYFSSICSPEVVFRVKFGTKNGNVQQIDCMETPTENVIEILNSKIKQSLLEDTGRVLELLDSVSKSYKQIESHPVIRSSAELIKELNCVPGQLISSKAVSVCLTSPTAVWLHLDPSTANTLMESIQQHVKSPEFSKTRPVEPLVGLSCLALFPDDQRWYRAIIENVDRNVAVVNYVDYGNSSTIGLDLLRPLPSSLVAQPALALKCALDGVERCPNELPSTSKCQSVIFDQTLHVTFIEKTEKHIFVRLRDTAGNDINEKLGLPASVAAPTNVGNQASNSIQSHDGVIPGAVDVRVSYVKSAGMFWIQYESNIEEIEQIRDNLRPLDSNNAPNVPPINVKENALYAVMHPEYNRFFRARANKVNGQMVEVFFLDIGYTDWVPLSSVRSCPAILKYIPPMANECTFRTPVYPDQYCEEIQKAFSDATEGVVCQAVFSGPQPAQGIHCIESLFAKGVNVGNLLYNLISSSAPQSGTAGGFRNSFCVF